MEDQNTSQKSASAKIIIIVAVIVVLAAIYVWARQGRSNESGQVDQGASVKQEEAAAKPETGTPAEIPPASSAVPAPGVNPDEVVEKTVNPSPEASEPESALTTVTHTDSGFSPQTVTIKKGETVKFMNESTAAAWPATAVHPTHTVYPGSDIKKCGTAEAAGMFDACRGLTTGESWSFQFNEVGSWKYHDHLNPSHYGTVVVTE